MSPPQPTPPLVARAAPFLRLAAVGMVLSALTSIYRSVQWWRVQDANIPDELDGLLATFKATAVVDGAAALLIFSGVLGAALALRGVMRFAALGATVYVIQVLIWAIQPFLAASELAALIGAIPWPVFIVAHLIMDAGLILMLIQRRGTTAGLPRIAIGVSLVVWGLSSAGRLGLRFDGPNASLALLLPSVISVAHSGAFVAVLLALAREAVPGLAAPMRPTAASSGLRLFGTGLKLRIVCLLGVVGLSVLMATSRSSGGMQAVLYGGTILSIGAGMIMIAGLARYAFAGNLDMGATLATLLMSVGLLIDGWVLTLLGDLFGGRFGAAMRAQDALGWAQGVGQILGLLAMLALLTSLRLVARLGERLDLANRAGGLMGLVVFVAALAVMVRGLVTVRSLPVALVLVLGVGALVAAIVMIMRLLGLISEVARTLDDAATSDTNDDDIVMAP